MCFFCSLFALAKSITATKATKETKAVDESDAQLVEHRAAQKTGAHNIWIPRPYTIRSRWSHIL